jgi:hypothetical protein
MSKKQHGGGHGAHADNGGNEPSNIASDGDGPSNIANGGNGGDGLSNITNLLPDDLLGFHKTLGHNDFGEVIQAHHDALRTAAGVQRDAASQATFKPVPRGIEPAPHLPPGAESATFTNPLAGLARDCLVPPPETFTMPPPPSVKSRGTAAEMTELYWMALLRDEPMKQFHREPSALVQEAVEEINNVYDDQTDLIRGRDLPCGRFTAGNLFRIGMPGEEVGPLISQFFLRDVPYGVQTIDQRMKPYRRGLNFMTRFDEWLYVQRTGRGIDGNAYPKSNEKHEDLYLEMPPRYASCLRDLARFVNKDALHQAYFNAALLLLAHGAWWTPGNPYFNDYDPHCRRDSGFGTLGGPHILALVSEVASRALQTVWYQKWQTWRRLRPEAYAGHLHVQEIGVRPPGAAAIQRRPYGLAATVACPAP